MRGGCWRHHGDAGEIGVWRWVLFSPARRVSAKIISIWLDGGSGVKPGSAVRQAAGRLGQRKRRAWQKISWALRHRAARNGIAHNGVKKLCHQAAKTLRCNIKSDDKRSGACRGIGSGGALENLLRGAPLALRVRFGCLPPRIAAAQTSKAVAAADGA